MDEPLAFTTSQQPTDLSQSAFVTLLLAIILGWILVALWTRFLENFAYGTLRLNEDSAWHAFVVSAAVTAIFVVFVYLINSYNIVPGQNFGDIFLSADNFPPGINEITPVQSSNVNTELTLKHNGSERKRKTVRKIRNPYA